MESGKYYGILSLLLFFIFVDLFINCFIFVLRYQNVVVLIIYLFQDICLVFSLIVISLMFVNTYIFQAGLTKILLKKFKLTIFMVLLYFTMTVVFHCIDLSERWKYPDYYYWDTRLTILFTVQRTLAAFHYFYYKRTALRLADPLFYKDSKWLRNWLKGIKSEEHDAANRQAIVS